jgi:polysaccharide pyruvyl transferase WcaK-like protein
MKVSFFGNFGSLNSGNESTLLAILARLRSVAPDGEFQCVCPHPEVVAARDGIDAIPISTRLVRVWDTETRVSRRIRMAFIGVGEEIKQYVRAFRWLKGTDMLIIPGTGLLTDAYGLTSWGPYSLFKWSLMARFSGCRVLFVSVGAGPIYSAAGRLLAKASLSLAEYRSYRDDSSKNYLTSIGFHNEGDRVYPDLVFSLAPSFLPVAGPPRAGDRRVVGIGLMEYAGRYSVARPSDQTYWHYLKSLASLVDWLLVQNYDVRLLLGDEDAHVIGDFRSLLRRRLGTFDEDRVIDEPIDSIGDLLAQIAATDIVVATRFHNALLALLLNRPVIAVSFHHKCASLMSEMDLSDYCSDIDNLDAEKLIDQFQRLERNYDAVRRLIERKVDESRRALDEQYELIFASL